MSSDATARRSRLLDALQEGFFHLAASGVVPPSLFERRLPPREMRAARTGRLRVEIVSHCWQYAHFLVYQLSSLVQDPPRAVDVTMTVFYSPEDTRTADLLTYFQRISLDGVSWNWQTLPRERLFRRAIGRNMAALATRADWVWFTDCDLMFRDGCLDALAELLQGRRDALVYPREERRTPLLTSDDPILVAGVEPHVLDVDTSQFTAQFPSRATGPLQIAHGDVCRACGYVDAIQYYQRAADHFRKAREDRTFRWLLRTQGTPLDIPGVYRIRHAHKGRYKGGGGTMRARIRTRIRHLQSWLRDSARE